MTTKLDIDYLVVGVGLAGAVVARQLADAGNKVLVIERRSSPAGNCLDHVDEFGVLVQDYGPHTFHTSSETVVEHIRRFEQWDAYDLHYGSMIDGHCIEMPFCFATLHQFYSSEEAKLIQNALCNEFPDKSSVSITELMTSSNGIIKHLGDLLFEKEYKPYSAKQWGMPPSSIDPSIFKRVPFYLSASAKYLNDKYVLMPHTSFLQFFKNMLKHKNITCRFNEDALVHIQFLEHGISYDGIQPKGIIFTGMVDELFSFRYGELPYRSLQFEFKHFDAPDYQQYPIVALPGDKKYTRITEYSKLPVQSTSLGTTICLESPSQYVRGANSPYYPISTDQSAATYQKYVEYAKNFTNLHLCGRLAQFKYMNMDQVIESALMLSKTLTQ